MRYFDLETDSYKLRQGSIIKDRIKLKIKNIEIEKSEYLVAMLTGDTAKGRFNSYYSKQITKEKAEAIVDNFTTFLSVDSQWKLFVVEPDFLKYAVDVYSRNEDLSYFEGDCGNNTATVIVTNNKGFLLLTNGIPQ